MKNSKLINILKTFSKEEMKQFEKFIASPYFHSGKNCKPLFKQLQKFYTNFESKNLTYEYIYKKLYPGRKFNKQVMWNLTSALEKMIDEFFIQQRLGRDEFSRYSLLLLELSARNAAEYFHKRMSKMEKFSDSLQIGEDDQTGIEYFRVKWKYEAIRGVYNQVIDRASLLGDQTTKRGEFLILSFLLNFAQDIYNINFLVKNYNYNPNINLSIEFAKSINFNEIINYLKENSFEFTWIVEFYYNKIMCILDEENEIYFNNLKKLFKQYHDKFTEFEIRNTFSSLTTYCLNKIKKGEEKFFETLFEINNLRLKENLAVIHGDLRKTLYIQMIDTALAVKEYDWTKEFIQEYSKKLNFELRESIKRLSLAMMHFDLKQYDKVLNNLRDMEFIDIKDKIYARILISKSYYEMKDIEPLLHNIDSSKHFFKNNKSITEEDRKSYHDFYSILTKMISMREDFDAFSILSIKNETMNMKELSVKKWLLEKLDELEATSTRKRFT